jgi:hypothetical protein
MSLTDWFVYRLVLHMDDILNQLSKYIYKACPQQLLLASICMPTVKCRIHMVQIAKLMPACWINKVQGREHLNRIIPS